MGIISENLSVYAEEHGIKLTFEMLASFELYADLLVEWNNRMNLTAITDPEEIAVKHFIDSLLLLKACKLPFGSTLIDVGTGAGFPAVPLKIARPDLKITLLDSLNKRVNFLKCLSADLDQENLIIHGRAEVLGHDPDFRERYDFALSRAVAAMPALCEYCLPFVKPGGIFAALKGPAADSETEAGAKAIKLLGGEIDEIRNFHLPNNDKRTVILIKKISRIPPKYPRTSVKITKKPI